MSRAVVREAFGGPEVLHVREVAEPHAGAGEVRVAVRVAALNPLDWQLASTPALAAAFGAPTPSGFGSDFAGVVDEVGPGVYGYAVGDRVYGGAIGRAVADHVVVRPAAPTDMLFRTPDGLADDIAAALPTAGLTAVAALAAVQVRAGDTVLVGGAAGGVGVVAVQLLRLAGARVLGTAAPSTAGFLRTLGAEPLPYGPGLAERVRRAAPSGIAAAMDLHGTEAAQAALDLGVPPGRICTVASGAQLPGVRTTGALAADPAGLATLADAVATGAVTVPIEASFPVERIHDAVALQAAGHVHGKVVVGF